MNRVESKSKLVGFLLPKFTDELVSGEPAKGLQPFCGMIGRDEVAEMTAKLVI